MPTPARRLSRDLTLFDVYAISTGAMFSSGFFLLPGLATAHAGPATVLAYLLAGVLILPAMYSQAELATAMPRAGGTYFFLDRSLGPLAGTIGGLGTWLALVFKSAFALIGMGAYLVFFFEVPIKPLAVGLTVAFGVLNVVGAKETSLLQRILVVALVAILSLFVAFGLGEIFTGDVGTIHRTQFSPFMPFGFDGLLATIGLVFVSYAGLTKVASVAEEVRNPQRNIPLGMMLSLATATLIYVVGVYIMIALLEPSELRSDLTPVATAAREVFDWLPETVGLILVVVAAVAAFASTGNAGMMSASRYPLAMARDRLLPGRLGSVGRFGTPVPAVVITTLLMVLVIVALDAEGVAKLASAFQLLIFGFLNGAVIVMRESRIASYLPAFRTPLYPWMQIAGMIVPVVLIFEMGALAIGLTLAVAVFGLLWYVYYVRSNKEITREGAIYHLFARLGQRKSEDIDHELRVILKEQGLLDETPFESLVTHADVLDLEGAESFEQVVGMASGLLAERLELRSGDLAREFLDGSRYGATPVSGGAALPHQRIAGLTRAHLVIVRARTGLTVHVEEPHGSGEERVVAVFFLVSPEHPPGPHLRILASIASRIDDEGFMPQWLAASTEIELKETLLRHDRYLSLLLTRDDRTSALIGRELSALDLPRGVLVALVHRAGDIVVPDGRTILRAGDRITVIGHETGIRELEGRFRG